MTRLLLAAVLAATLAACGSPEVAETDDAQPPSATGAPMVAEADGQASQRSADVSIAARDYVQMLAVGDIASCESDGDEKVAALAQSRGGRIALLGDIVYPSGTAELFRDCFDPAWGSMAARFRPAVGNHEYIGGSAGPYWDYFGDWSGQRGRGWYAYDAGPHWRVIVLNSNCSKVGCSTTSRQGQWLKGALQRAGDRHVMAVFHHARFSSGRHGNNATVAPFWKLLYAGGADLALVGHDHHYERFAPQTPAGTRTAKGIQQFIVGTGGYKNYDFGRAPLPNTAVRQNTTFGLLTLRLRPTGYSWWFLPADGEFTDSGSRRL